MKIIIAGDGKVGSMLTRQLSSEGHDVTVIDSNSKVLQQSVERYDVISVHGNCASMEESWRVSMEPTLPSPAIMIFINNLPKESFSFRISFHYSTPSLTWQP